MIKIATRSSALAKKQAEEISELLKQNAEETEFVFITSSGDKNQASPLSQIGGNGLFTKEIDLALLDKRADISVHSAKDLPLELLEGTQVLCVPKMQSDADLLIAKKGTDTTKKFVVGTSSPRRAYFVKQLFPLCEIKQIRGNIDTRIAKLGTEQYDAIVLAEAGINRLCPDLSAFDVSVLDIPHAACQGIIAVVGRKDDSEITKKLQSLTDEETMQKFLFERELLKKSGAGCKDVFGIKNGRAYTE